MVARGVVGLVVGITLASAQVPDVRIKFDLGAYGRANSKNHSQLRFYDTLGRPSTVSFTFFLESGLRAFAAQRFERLKGSGQTDFIDEIYVEDEGIWRVGKQYLPLGYGRIFAESVVGVRGESSLVLDGIPVVFAICDNGTGYSRGLVGRIGTPALNVFGAVGRHFAISGTSLTTLRLPEDAPGPGFGYRQLFGVEANRRIGLGVLSATVATLRQGEKASEPNFILTDVSYSTRRIKGLMGLVGVTYGSDPSAFVLRVAGAVRLDTRTDIEPMIRFKDGRFRDLTIGVRFRF